MPIIFWKKAIIMGGGHLKKISSYSLIQGASYKTYILILYKISDYFITDINELFVKIV